MDVDSLSPASRALLLQALPAGQLTNVLYRDGARLADGFDPSGGASRSASGAG